MCFKKSFALLKVLLHEHCKLSFCFLLCFVVMYFCKNGKGLILVDWTQETIQIVNEFLFTLACSYVCSFIFYFLTVFYPKMMRATPIKEIAKEDIRYAKDAIGGFFMSNGGHNDVDKISIEEIISCLGELRRNGTIIEYSIERKETEWVMLKNELAQVRDYLLFIKIESEFLNIVELNILKEIEDSLRTLNTIFGNHLR